MMWYRNARKGINLINFQINGPTKVFEDSTGAIDMSDKPQINERTKHINTAYHILIKHKNFEMNKYSTNK